MTTLDRIVIGAVLIALTLILPACSTFDDPPIAKQWDIDTLILKRVIVAEDKIDAFCRTLPGLENYQGKIAACSTARSDGLITVYIPSVRYVGDIVRMCQLGHEVEHGFSGSYHKGPVSC